jgi:ABC-type amino acid transport system permease subunit
LSSNFLPSFLAGMAVNFEIAGIALALGLALGILLAFARLRGGVARHRRKLGPRSRFIVNPLIRVDRARSISLTGVTSGGGGRRL